MEYVDLALNNKNTSDGVLSEIAKLAVKNNDQQLIEKLLNHPGTGPMTLCIIAK